MQYSSKTLDTEGSVAIIGMSCRFPGAKNIYEFWNNLKHGIESITYFSDDELIKNGNIREKLLKDSNFVKSGFIIDDIDAFDASFFEYSPKEATIMDPQHRIFLECAWEALEDSGYPPNQTSGSVGVFAGSKMSTYQFRINGNQNEELITSIFQNLVGNDKDYLTTRTSYKLNLKGPSVTVQSACSTSLVAVHLACESILNGNCDMALAGGSAIMVPQEMGYLHQQGMIFSSDGHCRPFDSNASGMVGGNGVGIVVLKRLSEAIEDRDHIFAVIRGSAVNNDGSMKIGYTAPSLDGQSTVIKEAMAIADVEADTISYVETHGTGTELGDPVEIAALTRVFRAETNKNSFCAIGSVKSNIGHLDTAAGIASLIKTALSIENGQIPPSLNFNEPNPRIDFGNSPFFVNSQLSKWESNQFPRRAGVSSFGFGGTNAHVVLEQALEACIDNSAPKKIFNILTVSAKKQEALGSLVKKYRDFLLNGNKSTINDICYTANIGRVHFPYRAAFISDSLDYLKDLIDDYVDNNQATDSIQGLTCADSLPVIAFLFTDIQSLQIYKIGRILYNEHYNFRNSIDLCDEILRLKYNHSVLSEIVDEDQGVNIYSHCALFSFQYAFASMLLCFGIKPGAVVGCGIIGEITAGCIAGLFSLEHGITIAASLDKNFSNSEAKSCFEQAIAAINYKKPLIDLISVNSGKSVTEDEISSSCYWSFQSSNTTSIPMASMIKNLHSTGYNIFFEIGMKSDPLFYDLKDQYQKNDNDLWLTGLETGDNGLKSLLDNISKLYVRGVDIDWNSFYKGKGLSRVSLPTYPFERKRFWIERKEKLSDDNSSQYRELWDTSVRDAKIASEQGISMLNLEDYSRVEPDMKRVFASYISLAFEQIGLFKEDDEKQSVDDLLMFFPILPKYKQLLPRLLNWLEKFGMIEQEGDFYKNFKPVKKDEINTLLHSVGSLDLFRQNPISLDFIIRSGENFGDVLTGKKDPMEVLFPESSFELVEEMYKNNPHSEYYNNIIRDILKGICSVLTNKIHLRILEIGAGTGSTTSALLDALPFDRVSYEFTDLSSLFLKRAKEKFIDYPFIKTSVLDIQEDPQSQGMQNESFDIVIASNVLHATRDMAEAIQHIRSLIAPGGLVLIREITRDMMLFDISFGPMLTELVDEPLRAGKPFLSVDKWKTLLKSNDFSLFEFFPEYGSPAEIIDEHVLIAMASDSSKSGAQPAFSYLLPPAFVENNFLTSSNAGPMIGMKIDSPVKQDIEFVNEISLSRFPYISDHKIHNNIFMPGTFFIMMALQGAELLFGTRFPNIENIKFENILPIPADSKHVKVQTVFSDLDSDKKSFRIFSVKPKSHDKWILNVSGSILTEKRSKNISDNLFATIKSRCNQMVSIQDYYRQTKERGFEYGSSFQGLKQIYVATGEAIGAVELLDPLKKDKQNHLMHPGMLDACFQMTGAILPDDIINDPLASFIDVGVENVQFYKEVPDKIWCYARLNHENGMRPDKNIAVDFTIFDTSGEIIADIFGFLIKVSRSEKVNDKELQIKLLDNFYKVRWQEQNRAFVAPEIQENQPGIWVIFADNEGLGLSLAEKLRAIGELCAIVSSGDKFAFSDKANIQHYIVDPLNPDDFHSLLTHINHYEHYEAATDRWRGIIHLWSTDEIMVDNPEDAQQRVCASVLHLVQAINSIKLSTSPKLWMVTKETQEVTDGEYCRNPSQSTLWGLSNVIATEYPELASVMIDIDSSDDETRADAIMNEILGQGDERQVAFRGLNRYVARFARFAPFIESSNKRLNLQSDATYLITGGLGGLGIVLTKWLVKNGARHIALIGRNKVKGDALQAVEELRSNGINVVTYQADVSQWEEIKTTVDKICSSMLPLKGVFHLAGVLDDANLADQEWSRFENVMKPKVMGAWNLHLLTKSINLSYFVLFSSVASMFGTHGQGNHAAANAFIDGLTSYRQALGLKSVSLNWGVWSEKGSAVNAKLYSRLSMNGVQPVTVQQGLELFEYALLNDFNRVAIISIDWDIYCKIFPQGQVPLFFSEFSSKKETDLSEKQGDLLTQLKNATEPLRIDLMKQYLKQKIADTLQMDAEMIKDNVDLIQLGMDSLIFIDLSRILSSDLGIQIVPHEVFENPEIGAMSELFLKDVFAKIDEEDSVVEQESLPGHKFVAIIDKDKTFEPFDLMDMQQAYLVGQSGTMELSNVSCHVYTEVESDSIDLKRYEDAWNQLIDRHEMLRALFLPSGKQIILRDVPAFKIGITDFRDLSQDDRESHLMAIRHRMSHQILDAQKWPLFEVRASQIQGTSIRLHISIDLLISDVHSIIIMMKELMAFYHNPGQQLEPIEITFRDYVISEKEFRKSALYNISKEYWLSRLETLPSAPAFPIIEKAGDIVKSKFVRRKFTLNKEMWSSAKKYASAYGLTPSLFLLSVYAKTISKWSVNPGFTINITLFNRMPLHPQVNQIVGDFTSVLLLAVDHSHMESFASMAGKIRNQFWEDMKHRYFSGIEVLRELAKKRSMNIMPVVFTSQLGYGGVDQLTPEKEFPGKVIYGITQTPQVWLDNQAREENNGDLVVFWDSVDAIFPEGFLDAMFDAYSRLIESLATNPDAWEQTDFMNMLPAQQYEKRLMVNRTEKPLTNELLHTLFINRAQDQPEHTAVISPSRTLSYKNLLSYSVHIGKLLRGKNIRPGRLVAVLMEKGWEQIAAVLGILQAGAAYIPIDPDLPQDRILYLLENSDAVLVLSQSWVISKHPLPDNMIFFAVDELVPSKDDFIPLEPVQNSDDLAYVIYTSGSTGLPKGVMINHDAVVNTIIDINERFSVRPSDKVLALASLNFDLSVYDIFGTLAAGATIVMPDAAKTREPSHWEELIRQEGVTIWNSVPQMMQMFIDFLADYKRSDLSQLRLVLLSGDWIPLTLPEKVHALAQDVKVVSLGGATEASIWSVFHEIDEVNEEWKSIPYGRPMNNQSCYVLDRFMEPCPDWVSGSLYIGGIGLASGYWRDNEKSAKSFIIHPKTGERVYRTGDKARFLPDGSLEFLGREDFQIKIRGHRVEPGEIETTLKEIPEVDNAVVMAVGKEKNEHQLIAYIVPNPVNKTRLLENVSADNPDFIETRWTDLVDAGTKQSFKVSEDIDIDCFKAYISNLKSLSRSYICRSLKKLGVLQAPGSQCSVSNIIKENNIKTKYHKIIRQWLDLLTKQGFLEQESKDRFRCIKALLDDDIDDLWRKVEYYSNWGGEKTHVAIQYLKQSVENHIGLLRGEVNPLELFFADASQETPESIYRFNPGAEYHNSIVREIVRIAGIKNIDEKIKIIEIGAGTGGTTASLLPVLPKQGTLYTFTDISSFFINEAKEKFTDYPFVEYRMLNINDDPLHQGYEANSYDIIVAQNVLHDAINIDRSLNHLKSLLSPGGIIIITEGTENTSLQMVSVAFIEGFGKFEDERIVDNLPLLSVDKWEKAIYRNGFDGFVAFPENGHKAEAFIQHTMLVKSKTTYKRLSSAYPESYLRTKVPAYMIPSQFIFIDKIPLTTNGKVDRKALLNIRNDTSYKPKADIIPAQNSIESFIVSILSKILKVEQIGVQDNFFDLGGDSLIAIQVISMIRKKFKVELSLHQIYEYPNIRQLSQLIQDSQDNYIGSSLVDMSKQNKGKPIFFMHQGSGDITVYNDLISRLSMDIKSYGLQSRGLYTSLPFHTNIEEMASDYINEIKLVQPQGPYTLCGYCMGGYIAFEIAKQLTASNNQVDKLILINSQPLEKDFYKDKINMFRLYMVMFFQNNFTSYMDQDLLKKIEEKEPDEIVATVFEIGSSKGVIPSNMMFSEFKRVIDVLNNNIRIMCQYDLQTYPGNIMLFRVQEQFAYYNDKPDFIDMWKNVAGSEFKVEDIPGNHFSCLREPNIAIFAEKMNQILKQ